MAVTVYPVDTSAALRRAALRWRGSHYAYTAPRNRRIDAQFTITPALNELFAIIEERSLTHAVRVKNTSGGTWTAPYLLKFETLKLAPQGSQTATNNPAAGTSVVITMAATTNFEVGQIVKITSGGYSDWAIITAVNSGVSITVSVLYYSHTLPTVVSEIAYEATAADADDYDGAHWVIKSNISDGAYGDAFGFIESADMDSSAFTVEALLYLSGTAGSYTATAPTGADQVQQAVGIVKKSHASTGRILWFPGQRAFKKFGTGFQQASSVSAAKLADAVADLIPQLATITKEAEGTPGSNDIRFTIQVQDAQGNNLAAQVLLDVWIGIADMGAAAAISSLTAGTGTVISSIVANGHLKVLTDTNGVAKILANPGAGSFTKYLMAAVAGAPVKSLVGTWT